MITTHIKRNTAPRLLAVYSFRYDAPLVPALIGNLYPLVDGWIAYDDRAGDGLFSHEVHRRVALLTAALAAGAQWVLAVDPDERFEAPLAGRIRELIENPDVTVYTFALRELYSPTQYRVDGVWGQKRQPRLLSLGHGIATPTGNLHLPWSYFIPQPKLQDAPFNLYHLKMIAPERRQARAALYNHLDPEHRAQTIGYDYLADDRGARLERIPRGREYHPGHEDDGGLWMPRLTPADAR
jgi:hypothetical protein